LVALRSGWNASAALPAAPATLSSHGVVEAGSNHPRQNGSMIPKAVQVCESRGGPYQVNRAGHWNSSRPVWTG
jgi:hypothetical protein